MTGSAQTPYAAIGGDSTVRDIAHRFYLLVENDPDYAELRALHAEDLGPIERALGGFLIGWLGGPRDWFDGARGCIFSLHGGIRIDAAVADQWAGAMRRAIEADPRIAPDIGARIADTLGRMARAMVNAGSDGEARPAFAAAE